MLRSPWTAPDSLDLSLTRGQSWWNSSAAGGRVAGVNRQASLSRNPSRFRALSADLASREARMPWDSKNQVCRVALCRLCRLLSESVPTPLLQWILMSIGAASVARHDGVDSLAPRHAGLVGVKSANGPRRRDRCGAREGLQTRPTCHLTPASRPLPPSRFGGRLAGRRTAQRLRRPATATDGARMCVCAGSRTEQRR